MTNKDNDKQRQRQTKTETETEGVVGSIFLEKASDNVLLQRCLSSTAFILLRVFALRIGLKQFLTRCLGFMLRIFRNI